ncbi:MAG: hypothetical protein AAFX94_01365 [Myxococcota bacterium]
MVRVIDSQVPADLQNGTGRPLNVAAEVDDVGPKMQRPVIVSGVDQSVRRAAVLPGSWRGRGPNTSGPDRNTLMMMRDPKNPSGGFAVVGQYSRRHNQSNRTLVRLLDPLLRLMPERLQLTVDVSPMTVHYVQSQGHGRYTLTPLTTEGGGLNTNAKATPTGELVLGPDGSMKGAHLTRRDPFGNGTEVIKFDGNEAGSRLEGFVPGGYFDSSDPKSGADYGGKDRNVLLTESGVAHFDVGGIRGAFDIIEPSPGIFTMVAQSPGTMHAEHVKDIEDRIWITLDIVSWKPSFTTNELIGINPHNPHDVRFLYEVHDRENSVRALVRNRGFVAPGIEPGLARRQTPPSERT